MAYGFYRILYKVWVSGVSSPVVFRADGSMDDGLKVLLQSRVIPEHLKLFLLVSDSTTGPWEVPTATNTSVRYCG